MDISTLHFRAHGPDLHLRVTLDNTVFFDQNLDNNWHDISCPFSNEQDLEHTLQIEMSGKKIEHTQINQQGDIVSDRLLNIENVSIDDVELGLMFNQLAQYSYALPETVVTHSLIGAMGHNGHVVLHFKSPWYIWFLENS